MLCRDARNGCRDLSRCAGSIREFNKSRKKIARRFAPENVQLSASTDDDFVFQRDRYKFAYEPGQGQAAFLEKLGWIPRAAAGALASESGSFRQFRFSGRKLPSIERPNCPSSQPWSESGRRGATRSGGNRESRQLY